MSAKMTLAFVEFVKKTILKTVVKSEMASEEPKQWEFTIFDLFVVSFLIIKGKISQKLLIVLLKIFISYLQ